MSEDIKFIPTEDPYIKHVVTKGVPHPSDVFIRVMAMDPELDEDDDDDDGDWDKDRPQPPAAGGAALIPLEPIETIE